MAVTRGRVVAAALSLLAAGCTLIAKSDLGAGVGAACGSNGDCQGGTCEAGACTLACSVDGDCPSPSRCASGKCKVGAVGSGGTGGSAGGANAGAGGATSGAADGECAATQICTASACITGCRASGDKACPAGSTCSNSVCVAGCVDDAGCGGGQICSSKACVAGCRDSGAKACPAGQYCDPMASTCGPTLKVAALFPGDDSDGYTTSHKRGLDDAVAVEKYVQFGAMPYHLTGGVLKADAFATAIGAEVTAGANVVVTASAVGTDTAISQATKYPSTTFLAVGSRTNGNQTNVGAYSVRTEQLWYVAGRIAAREADRGNKCIGLILPTPTKTMIVDTNAFVRGVKLQDKDIKVVIRWVGATRDFATDPLYSYKAQTYAFDSAANGKLFREELLAAQLADLKCTAIVHRTETSRVVDAVETRLKTLVNAKKLASDHELFSMGANTADACKSNGAWLPSCVGVAYYNWGPLYEKVFDQVERHVWSAVVSREAFTLGPQALTKFEQNPNASITGIAAGDAATYAQDIANKGPLAVFASPLAFAGQRDLDKDGKPDVAQQITSGTLEEEELDRMCWFVDGVYELADPSAPIPLTAAGVPDLAKALIPAMVPYGPPVAGQVTTLAGMPADQKKYGDVEQFLSSLGKDPTTEMSCPLN